MAKKPEIDAAEAVMTPAGEPVDLTLFPPALEAEPYKVSDTYKGHLALRADNMDQSFPPNAQAIVSQEADMPEPSLGVAADKVSHAEDLHDEVIGKTGPNPTNKQQMQTDVANAGKSERDYQAGKVSAEDPVTGQLSLPIYDRPPKAKHSSSKDGFWFDVAATGS